MTDARTNNNQLPLPHEEESIVLHSRKSVDDVWKEIVKQEPPDPHEMMTLEDFLAKAQEDDVKIPLPSLSLPLPTERLSSGGGGIFSSDVVVGGGCGNRRAILEPLDKAAQQRQRRMIKNRESAARSRERKQAYQAELESLALRLEEEHETLLKAKTEQTTKRYNQVAYRLDLPAEAQIHPTFHVSLLKLAHGSHVLTGLIPHGPRFMLTPRAVLDTKVVKRGSKVSVKILVHWEGLPIRDASWEFLEDMQCRFLDFHF